MLSRVPRVPGELGKGWELMPGASFSLATFWTGLGCWCCYLTVPADMADDVGLQLGMHDNSKCCPYAA